MKFRVVIEPDEDGGFVSSCPSLPGCWSQGDTYEEARTNIIDAIKGYIESLKKHGDPLPPSITEEVVEIDIGRSRDAEATCGVRCGGSEMPIKALDTRSVIKPEATSSCDMRTERTDIS